MLPYVVVAVVIVIALLLLNGNQTKVNDIKTGELIDAIQNKEVTEITICLEVFFYLRIPRDYSRGISRFCSFSYEI